MHQETVESTAEAPLINPAVGKKQISAEEISDYFRCIEDDIEQIGKLASQENTVVKQFFSSLQKVVEPVSMLIPLSVSVLPYEFFSATQATIDPKGLLTLTFEDGHQEVKNLKETKNRELLFAIMEDFASKFAELTQQIAADNLKPNIVEEIQAPSPPAQPPTQEPPPTVVEQPQIMVPETDPEQECILPKTIEEEIAPKEILDPAEDLTQRIGQVEAETLEYLGNLADEIFETAPISKYLEDWLVNLRQIVLSFESDEVIGPEEAFTAEYNKIFAVIQDELTRRLADEADIEVSNRVLVENRYLLDKVDESYVAESKDIVVRGKDAIDYLIRNIRQIEQELYEVRQTNVSYLHLLQKMEKDQKVSELAQKLNSAKKRLALAVANSSGSHGSKPLNLDEEFEAQSHMLEEKRKAALEFLDKNVRDLQEQLVSLKNFNTNNPMKRVANQQQIYEFNQKLVEAKKRYALAEKSSSDELENLRTEHEKKKREALVKIETLEKNIALKAVDSTIEARKAMVEDLKTAVQACAHRKKQFIIQLK